MGSWSVTNTAVVGVARRRQSQSWCCVRLSIIRIVSMRQWAGSAHLTCRGKGWRYLRWRKTADRAVNSIRVATRRPSLLGGRTGSEQTLTSQISNRVVPQGFGARSRLIRTRPGTADARTIWAVSQGCPVTSVSFGTLGSQILPSLWPCRLAIKKGQFNDVQRLPAS